MPGLALNLPVTIDWHSLKSAVQRFNLDLVVLFGSRARGLTASRSDVDVAVHVKGLREEPRPQWWWDLLEAMERVVGEKMHLLLLNRAGPLVSYEVACWGMRVYEEREDGFCEFQVLAARRYEDTAEYRRVEDEFLRKSFLSESEEAGQQR